MKTFFKRFLIFMLIAFVVIQFIRPVKNISTTIAVNDITTKYAVPPDVMTTLKASCYDCHSNNTAYPWYNNIQPVAWFLADHVKEGKKELNFNEFAAYKIGRQYKKLDDIIGETEEGGMPIESYTLIHKNAVLSAEQKKGIANWANAIRDTIKANYPADSLKRPQKPSAVHAK